MGFTDAVETLATRLGLTVPREGQTEKNNAAMIFINYLLRSTYIIKKN